ncbi:MAG: hypothetical protein OXR82_19735 [Gammaproteobacteria bacterium]|nr:hypothetical protein [Gammaproteobacteria bacterium]
MRRRRQAQQPSSVRPAVLLVIATTVACGDESVVDLPTAPAAASEPRAALAAAQASDRDILVAFYNATGPNWTNSENWLTDAPLGDWHGVRVDATGRVTGLTLEENGLSGSIPPDVGGLAKLNRLDLADNRLSGSIPAELGRLANLGTLWLARNELTGPIPPNLGDLANVFQMSLANNRLSGTIPAELGSMVSLGFAQLQDNHLTGTIPSELGNLAVLEELFLDGNRLTGPIPESFLKLSDLAWFTFSRNAGLCSPGTLPFVSWLQGIRGVTGPYCNELDAKALESLYGAAGGSRWTHSDGWLDTPALEEWYGVVADSLGRVRELDLTQNGLDGRLPASLGNLVSMIRLRIGDNPDLSGRLPNSLSRTPLEELLYANTGLCAPVEAWFQEWLGTVGRHEGTGVQCPPPSDRDILTALYETTDGANWEESGNWVTDAPLAEWHGVETNADGRVVSLDLKGNGLRGPIPPELGGLTELDTLSLWGNDLGGPIPPELGELTELEQLFLHRNRLTSVPPELGRLASLKVLAVSFNQLESLPPELGGLAALEELYLCCNQLTSAPSELGRLANLRVLSLEANELATIPATLGRLQRLQDLLLSLNRLASIPLELGRLANLELLDLDENQLASIPPELARLENLGILGLKSNELTAIPAELSALERLRWLALEGNRLASIPHRSGGFASLEILDLSSNEFTSFPGELSGLGNLRVLELDGNRLTHIPSGLGSATGATRLDFSQAVQASAQSERWSESYDPWRLDPDEGLVARDSFRKRSRAASGATRSSPDARTRTGVFPSLDVLDLSSNELSGPLPAGLLEFTGIASLGLAGNSGLSGPLPLGLTALERLDDLHTTGTGLCAPADPELLDWLDGVTRQRVALCAAAGGAAAYLTQAVQSLEFPVPLVAGEPALLRVFVTAQGAAGARMPPVRATFYMDGAVIHRAEILGTSDPIPAAVNEGSLSGSANAEIPGRVIQPGLEVVIEPDPEGTLDPVLGVVRRIPAVGRMAVDVRAMPVFEVTLVPFLWEENPDSSIIETVAAMAANPEGHELFERTHLLLPISEIDATAHPPVATSTNDGFELLHEVEMIRIAEGGRGHYLAVMAPPTTPGGLLGVANDIGSWSSFSVLDVETIAHEFGHNRNLYHAPCGGAGGPDRYYPYGEGNIGAWGYDFGSDELVPPGQPDFMSYCEPTWTSDYQFTNAVRYRLETETGSILIATADVAQAASARALLLWGGLDGEGAPRLRPSFFIDAPPALPEADGPWSLTGTDGAGTVLFSLSFAMSEFTDTDDGRAGFSFAVPVTWTEELAEIALQGPEGSATLDRDTDLPMTVLRDPATGRIRGILDGVPQPAAPGTAAAVAADGQDLQILFSRGIPNRGNER